MLRRDWPEFSTFGEVYFSSVNPGHIKGWHRHTRKTVNFAVPVGRIRLALVDERDGSATYGQREFIHMGGDDYVLVTVPPGIWYALEALDETLALVANCATEPYDPGESEKRPLDDPAVAGIWN